MRTFIVVLITAVLSSSLTYWLTDPRQHANGVQEAIISRVIAVYCTPDPTWSKDRYFGNTMAMSRTAVAAGLGPLAVAEIVKCKIKDS